MQVTANTKKFAVVSQVVLTSSIALLTHATKNDGDYSYNTVTVQLFSEVRPPAYTNTISRRRCVLSLAPTASSRWISAQSIRPARRQAVHRSAPMPTDCG